MGDGFSGLYPFAYCYTLQQPSKIFPPSVSKLADHVQSFIVDKTLLPAAHTKTSREFKTKKSLVFVATTSAGCALSNVARLRERAAVFDRLEVKYLRNVSAFSHQTASATVESCEGQDST